MTNMNATFGFSLTALRRATFAAVLLGSTMLVVASPAHASPAHAAPVAQATVIADANDAGEGASFRVSEAEGGNFYAADANDAGEGASFRVSEAEGGNFYAADAGDAGEGAVRAV